ncbi:PTS lactose/cellobiose transporter subunit IIA [Bacillus sp. EB106-08-02-XG196]|uniref:PTS lactose/cellobiose transporter subunit IIA n=1 Tax=Bacillus sp. EB106-08-02-XG196 TaxID=2737049 RepID=UPI0015C4E349|nr:PTS lactose/cellobiose transporter subunit IIA [Bacillus sp. EB106-08-02-XG196]
MDNQILWCLIFSYRSGQFDKAEQKLNEAKQELNKAHRFQTELIKKESGGDTYDIRIILVHAQDHLMNAMTLKDMAVEIIDLRREIKK